MNLAEKILETSFEDVSFKPFTNNMRQRILTRIIVVDSVPEKYLCKKVYELDFWNEISGWFHSNINHKVVDTTHGEVEIPSGMDVREGTIGSLSCLVAAGDHFVDSEYNVYRCYGWEKSGGGADIYFDFI